MHNKLPNIIGGIKTFIGFSELNTLFAVEFV